MHANEKSFTLLSKTTICFMLQHETVYVYVCAYVYMTISCHILKKNHLYIRTLSFIYDVLCQLKHRTHLTYVCICVDSF